eukprot:TRINITY_DN4621_c0_g1_i1.p1 TRINITY_DN4621_c0_g1~~TRINITY_DN4621_c0_g1_i1.p1  ORF type:complete len:304 (-),score=65.15 TRINITY_DN4621_c0_g1_i1:296-1207(-)
MEGEEVKNPLDGHDAFKNRKLDELRCLHLSFERWRRYLLWSVPTLIFLEIVTSVLTCVETHPGVRVVVVMILFVGMGLFNYKKPLKQLDNLECATREYELHLFSFVYGATPYQANNADDVHKLIDNLRDALRKWGAVLYRDRDRVVPVQQVHKNALSILMRQTVGRVIYQRRVDSWIAYYYDRICQENIIRDLIVVVGLVCSFAAVAAGLLHQLNLGQIVGVVTNVGVVLGSFLTKDQAWVRVVSFETGRRNLNAVLDHWTIEQNGDIAERVKQCEEILFQEITTRIAQVGQYPDLPLRNYVQ